MRAATQTWALRLVAAAVCMLPTASQAASPVFDRMLVFGDSVSDVGNGSIIWNSQSSAPYQAAIPQNDYSNNRYTDGPDTQPATSQPALIWTDLLAGDLNVPAPTASLVGGTDYAAFGATTTNGSPTYPSVDVQVQQAIARGISPNSLYVFWGGANDITNQFDPNAVVSAAAGAAQVIGQQISLLAAGGAKNFVWINLPALDRIPGSASPDPVLNNAYAQASITFNQQQAAAVAQLQRQYLGRVSIVMVDSYALFTNILNDPYHYGFSNVTSSAADQQGVNPDSYFFWKSGHFTTTGHAAIAYEVNRIIQREFSGDGSATSGVGTANGNLDFDGDGRRDFTVWRPYLGNWYISPNSNPAAPRIQQWGLPLDVPVPGDYDGDRIADQAVWRPSNGTWYIIPSSNPSAAYTQQWGQPGDIPVPGDYDGDGRIDFAVWRPSTGTWYVIPSSSPATPRVMQWGLPGDIPVPGDFDGDNKADYAVWRPDSGTWYILQSSNPGSPIFQQWGLPGDIPIPGDYDGDGRADCVVWRPSAGAWYVLSSRSGSPTIVNWGLPGDIPVFGDFDGDRTADYAVWRPSNGTWYVIPSSNPGVPFSRQWGVTADIPR